MKRSEAATVKIDTENAEKPDVNKIMADIRARVRSELQREAAAPVSAQSIKRRGFLKTLGELNFLNKNYNYPTRTLDATSVSSHRAFFGNVIVSAKRKLYNVLRNHLFLNYFSAQEEFNANLVRLLNELTDALDTRNARMEGDVVGEMFDLERRFSEQLGSSLSDVQRQLSDLNQRSLGQETELKGIQGITLGLEQIVSLLSKAPREGGTAPALTEVVAADYSYLLFENRFRGDERIIRERLTQYPDLFKNAAGPVLEIGAGRGELQQLFKEHNIKSYGLEFDEGMLAICGNKGLDVRNEEGLAHLRARPDHSLGGIIAIQVVEHLTPSQLKELFELCWRKVVVGGVVAFETINTQSLIALNQTYYRDPTHQQPLHPQTLSFIAEMAGLKIRELRMLSAFPKEVELQKLELRDGMSPRWNATLETLNRNIDQLNKILFGFQDYCLIAEVA